MIREYLRFSRRERMAVLVIVCVILVVFLLPEIIVPSRPENHIQPADTAWITSLKRLETRAETYRNTEKNMDRIKAFKNNTPELDKSENTPDRLFYFDPNTVRADALKQLGLRERTIRTIQNFRNKGGRFHRPGDFQKIYGLAPHEFERLAPYIRIAVPLFVKSSGATDSPRSLPRLYGNDTRKKFDIIDINLADTSAFISLPGIGSKLSARIVAFREKLGGFYSVEQVGETFGLPDSTFQKIRRYLDRGSSPVKKININRATLEELGAHPYIRYGLARPIIAYRNEKGSFQAIEDLKKVMAVTDGAYQKMFPYLSL